MRGSTSPTGRREITIDELRSCDYVATMELFDARRRRRRRRGRHPRLGARRPRRSGPRPGARIRDEIRRRVVALFDEFSTTE